MEPWSRVVIRNQNDLERMMWEWLAENHLSVSALVNTGMLLVWMVYLGVFLRQYRRQTRPRILINRGAGETLDANCFITNMSSEPVYLEAVNVRLEHADGAWNGSAIDVRIGDGERSPDDPRQRTHQGPIQPAQYINIGTFRSLIDRVADVNPNLGSNCSDKCDGARLCIKVYADYASEDLIVGAERRFDLSAVGGQCAVRGVGRTSDQIRSRSRRRRAEAELRQTG